MGHTRPVVRNARAQSQDQQTVRICELYIFAIAVLVRSGVYCLTTNSKKF